MFSALRTNAHAATRSISRYAYSTSASASSGGTSKLLTVGLPLGLSAGAAYYYFSSGDSKGSSKSTTVAAVKRAPASTALDPNAFVDFKLRRVEKLTPNTSRFEFELAEDQALGMTVTSCVVTKFVKEDGKPVIRPYTPVSDADQTGSFDLIVKRYEGGPMSSHIHDLKVGDTLAIKGPITKYPLKANQHDTVGLIAGGSGITPILQIVSGLLKDKADKTKISLIFANVTPEDIIVKDELDAFAKAHPDRFKVTYVIDKPAPGWSLATGYVNADLIKAHLPAADSANTKIFVCGPPPMMSSVCGPKGPNFTQGDVAGALKDLGFTNEQVFKF